MKLLLDTQFLLWSGIGEAEWGRAISADVQSLLQESTGELYFSAVSVWEVAIKYSLGRPYFRVDPHIFRRELLDRDYRELAITGEHATRVGELPRHHKDPFDRLLAAQAMVEGITLLTVDVTMARYGGPVRQV